MSMIDWEDHSRATREGIARYLRAGDTTSIAATWPRILTALVALVLTFAPAAASIERPRDARRSEPRSEVRDERP